MTEISHCSPRAQIMIEKLFESITKLIVALVITLGGITPKHNVAAFVNIAYKLIINKQSRIQHIFRTIYAVPFVGVNNKNVLRIHMSYLFSDGHVKLSLKNK